MSRQHRPDLIQMARKVGITEEEMREWLNAGKKAQQEVIDKLKADPEWRAMAKRFGVKLNAE